MNKSDEPVSRRRSAPASRKPQSQTGQSLGVPRLGREAATGGGGVDSGPQTHTRTSRLSRGAETHQRRVLRAQISEVSFTVSVSGGRNLAIKSEKKTRSYQSDSRFSRDDPQFNPSWQVSLLLATLLLKSSDSRLRTRRRPIRSHRRSSIASSSSSSSSDGRKLVFRERLVEVPTEEVRVDEAFWVGDGRDLPDDGRG